jgi:hypothetical protein
MAKADWEFSGHVDTVTVTFQADPLVAVELDAGEIDEILRNLGDLRALMKPSHPSHVPNEEDANFIVDPLWECKHDPLVDQRVLRIRDPRFGWLRYVISADTAWKLADALTSLRNVSPQSPNLN